LVRTISLVLFAILAAVETMLAFRLAFLAAGANAANNFVEFIYDSTGWLADPFEGIIANRAMDGGGTFEPATLIAMFVYAVAVGLFAILMGHGVSARGERSKVDVRSTTSVRLAPMVALR
jgi:hypothetical protein